MKKLAPDNFKLDETGGDFSKRVENTVEKEKLRRKTKSPFPTVFLNICTVETLKQGLVWEKSFRFVGVTVKNQSRRW